MVLGIDLGTTYSVAAYLDEEGRPCAITNTEGDKLTPSMVYFENDEKVIVGTIAKDFMTSDSRRVVSKVKNVIGRENPKTYKIGDRTYLPQDISSLVLRKLVRDAEIFLGKKGEIRDVVVTVPAYFTDAQRSATNEAVELAGLNLLANVNEPTAAAIYYADRKNLQSSNTMVFDLGGGTFDVTILHVGENDVQVKSTKGLSGVGGSFFDEQLLDYVCEQFEEKHGLDITDDEDVYNDLLERIESVKKQLCSNKTQSLVAVNMDGVRDRIAITYDYFVSVISDLYESIENVVGMAISEAGLTVDQIDQIIMVGGSSRIPYIEEKLTAFMGKAPLRVVNPDEVVALGAALYANRIIEKTASNVKDVCSHGFGLLRYNAKAGKMCNTVLVPRNTQMPAQTKTEGFVFAEDGQKYLKLAMTEGDKEDPFFTVTIRETAVPLPAGIKQGMKYEMEFAVDAMQGITVTIFIPDLGEKIVVNSKDENEEGGATGKREDIAKRAAQLQRIEVN